MALALQAVKESRGAWESIRGHLEEEMKLNCYGCGRFIKGDYTFYLGYVAVCYMCYGRYYELCPRKEVKSERENRKRKCFKRKHQGIS